MLQEEAQRTGSIGASSTLRLVDLQQVARGLWRWVSTHPEWEPPEQEDSPADWPAEVGCVAYETPDTLVLIDPLVGDGDQAALDEHAAPKERVAILEKELTRLKHIIQGTRVEKDWRKTFGMSANDPGFDEMIRLGREIREQDQEDDA